MERRFLALNVLLCLLLLCLNNKASANVDLEVVLIHYNNPGGFLKKGMCCDEAINGTSTCPMCDTVFKLCPMKGGQLITKENGRCKWNASLPESILTQPIKSNRIAFNESNTTTGLSNPTTFIIASFPMAGVQLYVAAKDFDDGKRQLIDEWVIEINQTLLRQGSVEVTTLAGNHNIATLQLSYQLHCSENYYGKDCSAFCKPQDDRSTCNEQGKIICKQGFQGPNCTETFSSCTTENPCQNRGQCNHDIATGYICHCLPGYTGKNCETITSGLPTPNANSASGHQVTVMVAVFGGVVAISMIVLSVLLVTVSIVRCQTWKKNRLLTGLASGDSIKDPSVPFSNPMYQTLSYQPQQQLHSYHYETALTWLVEEHHYQSLQLDAKTLDSGNTNYQALVWNQAERSDHQYCSVLHSTLHASPALSITLPEKSNTAPART